MTLVEFHAAVVAMAKGACCSTTVEATTYSNELLEVRFAAYVAGYGWAMGQSPEIALRELAMKMPQPEREGGCSQLEALGPIPGAE